MNDAPGLFDECPLRARHAMPGRSTSAISAAGSARSGTPADRIRTTPAAGYARRERQSPDAVTGRGRDSDGFSVCTLATWRAHANHVSGQISAWAAEARNCHQRFAPHCRSARRLANSGLDRLRRDSIGCRRRRRRPSPLGAYRPCGGHTPRSSSPTSASAGQDALSSARSSWRPVERARLIRAPGVVTRGASCPPDPPALDSKVAGGRAMPFRRA